MKEENTHPIQQEKIRKLQDLRSRGVEPYPHIWNREKTSILYLNKKFEALSVGEKSEKTFHIAGRLMRKRDMGKTAFFNILDENEEIQCYIRRDDFVKNKLSPENPLKDSNQTAITAWELWKLCDIGDILGLSGLIFKTKKGELSLRIQSLAMLCKTIGALPEKYHGLQDKEIKYRYRHLDLIMDTKARKVFKTRSKIIYEIRKFLTEKGFIEVETPILQPLYGGAVAFPFETHFRRLNQKMYLKISPEIYLKKLIVGGFEKVFEIGKNFRNEGIDRSHSPEFTMLEYYEAYTDYNYQMQELEKLVSHVAQKIKGQFKFKYQGRELDISPPWAKISLKEFKDQVFVIMGIKEIHKQQKGMLLEGFKKGFLEFLALFWNIMNEKISPQRLKEKQVQFLLKALPPKERPEGDITFSQLKEITEKLRAEGVKGAEGQKSPNSANDLLEYVQSIDPQNDLRAFIHSEKQNLREDLRLNLALLALELTAEKYFWNPVFLTDFPKENSPLTKKHRKDPQFVERFEPYIAGMEIGNAYTELNDPIDQRERLEKQRGKASDFLKNKAESPATAFHPVDENFLHAIETGMPPTGGVGLGIERLVMILTDQRNLKDSTLFPVLRDKGDKGEKKGR